MNEGQTGFVRNVVRGINPFTLESMLEVNHASGRWESHAFGDLCDIRTGKLDSNAATEDGEYPFFTCAPQTLKIDNYAFDCEALLLAGNNAAGNYSVKHYKGKFNAYQRTYVIEIKEDNLVLYEYLRRVLEGSLDLLQRLSTGSSTKFLTMKVLLPLKIILPPLELQAEYVQIMRHIDEILYAVTENTERIRDFANSYFSTQVAVNV